ncbi:hypothetical protein CW304_00180 [Bacillus sp. UFRGS-B20]|nr:hypothetical protein CW304_00180 [Bacillus sp. UFRGS-B20]
MFIYVKISKAYKATFIPYKKNFTVDGNKLTFLPFVASTNLKYSSQSPKEIIEHFENNRHMMHNFSVFLNLE